MKSDPNLMDELISSRHSVRAYLDKPVQKTWIAEILDIAAKAPSGSNIQPWKVYVLEGAKKASLVQKVCALHEDLFLHPTKSELYRPDYAYYPSIWVSPFLERRRKNGWGLYSLLGIEKGEKEKMHQQHRKNFEFFGAPVGLFFTAHRSLEGGSLIDYGMFLQNLMLAAKARGLDTCPQAAWNSFSEVIMSHIGASEEEKLICGMSLGWSDQTQVVNTFMTPRLSAETFTTWLVDEEMT
jgi:nitroreductase